MAHQITLRTLIHDIIPRLQATEKLVNNTLSTLIEATQDPVTRAERQEQKDTFALALYRIRLNLQPLLEQHADAVVSVQRDADTRVSEQYITLDEHQHEALRAIQGLYEQVRQLSRPGRE